jgi:phenylpropionate dioxygenase-like ring-hydroxylating dioxygenase large terminal subunit
MQDSDSRPPRDTIGATRHALESERIFSRTWAYAGLTSDIESSDDYLRIPVAGHDVIVQNLGGRPRAFINACSHRHSLIHTEPRGRRPLVCPYHGWAYDHEGIPTRIPSREEFPEVMANPKAFGLRSVALDCAGKFIFVKVEPGGPGLAEFLGEAANFLEKVSGSLVRPLDEFSTTMNCNWKIALENSLEGYHVPMVHRSTIAASDLFSSLDLSVDRNPPRPAADHSVAFDRVNQHWLRRWRRFSAQMGTWPFSFDHYVHQLVFPMLTVTSFLGYSFHIQRFHPDAHDATTVHSRIFASGFEGQTERGRRTAEILFSQNIEFTRQVFEEDRRACERVHAGMGQATAPAHFADVQEKRVADFRNTYRRLLGPLD